MEEEESRLSFFFNSLKPGSRLVTIQSKEWGFDYSLRPQAQQYHRKKSRTCLPGSRFEELAWFVIDRLDRIRVRDFISVVRSSFRLARIVLSLRSESSLYLLDLRDWRLE